MDQPEQRKRPRSAPSNDAPSENTIRSENTKRKNFQKKVLMLALEHLPNAPNVLPLLLESEKSTSGSQKVLQLWKAIKVHLGKEMPLFQSDVGKEGIEKAAATLEKALTSNILARGLIDDVFTRFACAKAISDADLAAALPPQPLPLTQPVTPNRAKVMLAFLAHLALLARNNHPNMKSQTLCIGDFASPADSIIANLYKEKCNLEVDMAFKLAHCVSALLVDPHNVQDLTTLVEWFPPDDISCPLLCVSQAVGCICDQDAAKCYDMWKAFPKILFSFWRGHFRSRNEGVFELLTAEHKRGRCLERLLLCYHWLEYVSIYSQNIPGGTPEDANDVERQYRQIFTPMLPPAAADVQPRLFCSLPKFMRSAAFNALVCPLREHPPIDEEAMRQLLSSLDMTDAIVYPGQLP